jgi:hypothetical protein
LRVDIGRIRLDDVARGNDEEPRPYSSGGFESEIC